VANVEVLANQHAKLLARLVTKIAKRSKKAQKLTKNKQKSRRFYQGTVFFTVP
jgi:hypothetical protein